MRLIQMNGGEGPVMPKGPAELNQHMQSEQKQKVRGGITGEGQELSAEEESRINGGIADENLDGRTDVLKNKNHIQQLDLAVRESTAQQQTHQDQPMLRWEQFLPVGSLKVLLVENDDSTRHLVSALLRNCGYEVEAVANGLQAWKVLQDLTANIDLVLTEVVLPCLTGIGLLSKIMNHKTCKNIPVIMMSSHDSVSVVFKCLSKGAVDFLVKPIRKNELKNLWQHVWRKCHSSSGSGSESGVRTQKSTKSESGEHSDNKHNNREEDDIGSIDLNARERSDNGSGTQSSCTKMTVEVDSVKAMSPWEPLGDPPGNTCAQVIHSMSKTIGSNRDCQKQDDELALNMARDMELEMEAPRKVSTLQPHGQWEEVPSNLRSEKERVDEEQDKVQGELNSTERSNGECKNLTTDPTGSVTNNTDLSQVLDNPNGNIYSVKHNSDKGDKELPSSFEFSSKSLNSVGDLGSSEQNQNILRQSDRSAFLRYNVASHQAPTGNVGSCSPKDNSSEAAKTESMQGLQSYFKTMPTNQRSNGSKNKNDMGSSTNNSFTKSSTTIHNLTQKSTIKCLQPSSAFQPVQYASSQPAPQENGEKQNIQVQFHHHHHHHHHLIHMHNMAPQQLVNRNGQSVQNKIATSLHHGSSIPLRRPIKSDAGNQSLNGSASLSNHGSNATLLGKEANMEGDNRGTEKEGTASGIRFETGNASSQDRFALREAALNKFRQKRKERCFEKKVRYQSRKKLAEQRPRVRGQFVRHAVEETTQKDTLQ